MAHGFNNLGRNTTFASKREIAWHGLGSVVEAMTSEEAIILGGMDFEVNLAPVYANINIKDYNGEFYTHQSLVNGKQATYRTDTNETFGIVGGRYTVLQNTECFKFFDDIIGEGHAAYETVGALGNGETVFLTAKLSKELVINKDLVDQYLLLTNTHDGSGSVNIMFTPIRVVCNNTLTMALNSNKSKFTIRHTKNLHNKLKQAENALGIVKKQSVLLKETMEHIAKISIDDKKAIDIICSAFNFERNDKGEFFSTRSVNLANKIYKSYQIGVGQEGIVGTGYGLYNGVTTYLQNVQKVTDKDAFFKNSFMGKDDVTRNKVLQNILELT